MAKHAQNTPTRAKRLKTARKWIASYRGKNLVRGYKKRFGVSGVCAVVELRMLGIDIPDTRLEQARRDEEDRAKANARRKEKWARSRTVCESDETFAIITGYTEGGAPYGVTWDEWGGLDVW